MAGCDLTETKKREALSLPIWWPVSGSWAAACCERTCWCWEPAHPHPIRAVSSTPVFTSTWCAGQLCVCPSPIQKLKKAVVKIIIFIVVLEDVGITWTSLWLAVQELSEKTRQRHLKPSPPRIAFCGASRLHAVWLVSMNGELRMSTLSALWIEWAAGVYTPHCVCERSHLHAVWQVSIDSVSCRCVHSTLCVCEWSEVPVCCICSVKTPW